MRASLAILAVLGGMLVLTGLQGSTATPAPDEAGSALGPDVGLRIVAPDPARTLPSVTRALETAAPSLGFPRGVRSWRADLEDAGLDPERDLLAPFSVLVISLERSCPPPALLVCRPALRAIGRLRGEPPADLERYLRIAVVAGLRAAGFHDLRVESSASTDARFAVRVTSRGETLARWRLSGGVLEVATGGLVLDSPAGAAALAATSRGTTDVEIDTNPQAMAAILG